MALLPISFENHLPPDLAEFFSGIDMETQATQMPCQCHHAPTRTMSPISITESDSEADRPPLTSKTCPCSRENANIVPKAWSTSPMSITESESDKDEPLWLPNPNCIPRRLYQRLKWRVTRIYQSVCICSIHAYIHSFTCLFSFSEGTLTKEHPSRSIGGLTICDCNALHFFSPSSKYYTWQSLFIGLFQQLYIHSYGLKKVVFNLCHRHLQTNHLYCILQVRSMGAITTRIFECQ